MVIPTHRPMVRKDDPTRLPDAEDKFEAVVGTSACVTSAASRCWSARPRSRSPSSFDLLKQAGVPHGAERQAARARGRDRRPAGRPGVITIATNMAGRGTDIVLGGNVETRSGSSPPTRPSSRPTAAQAASCRRGRSAHERSKARRRPAHHRHRAPRVAPHRQPAARPLRPPGRPGLEPLLPVAGRPLMRIFAGDRVKTDHGAAAGMPGGEAIEAGIVTARSKTCAA